GPYSRRKLPRTNANVSRAAALPDMLEVSVAPVRCRRNGETASRALRPSEGLSVFRGETWPPEGRALRRRAGRAGELRPATASSSADGRPRRGRAARCPAASAWPVPAPAGG